jgi:O-antigen ligase
MARVRSMDKSVNFKNLILLVPILLIPIFGSFSLGFILIMAASLSFHFIIKKSQGNRPTPFRTIGAIFILYFTYYAVQGFYFRVSFLQHIHDIGKIFPILIIGVLALLLKTNTFKINYRMLGLLATCSIYLTSISAFIIVFYQPDIVILEEVLAKKTGVLGRLEMGAGNALPFSVIFMTFSFLTCLGYEKKSTLEKIVSLSALLLGIFVVGLWSCSRGPLLLVIPLTFLMLWYLFKNSKSEQTWYPLTAGSIVLVSLTISWFAIQNFENCISTGVVSGLKELAYGKGNDGSVSIRLSLYKGGLEAFTKKPFFGYGIGNIFDSAAPYLPKGNNIHFSHLHNVFINHLVAGGLIGLVFLFMLIASPLLILWQKRDTISINGIYLSLLIVIVISGAGMSNVFFFHDLLSGFFSTLILMAAIAANKQDN